jgi:hypothetical protein
MLRNEIAGNCRQTQEREKTPGKMLNWCQNRLYLTFEEENGCLKSVGCQETFSGLKAKKTLLQVKIRLQFACNWKIKQAQSGGKTGI